MNIRARSNLSTDLPMTTTGKTVRQELREQRVNSTEEGWKETDSRRVIVLISMNPLDCARRNSDAHMNRNKSECGVERELAFNALLGHRRRPGL